MRSRALLTAAFTIGACLAQTGPAVAQTAGISDAECQSLRQRLSEHARLSEGVRRAVAAQAGPAPSPAAAATPTAPPPPAPTPPARGDAIRARLEQIPKERQTLDDQRLASMVRFDLQ